MKSTRIAEVTEPFLRSCLKRTRKRIQSTRRVLSERFEKAQNTATSAHEVNEEPTSKKSRVKIEVIKDGQDSEISNDEDSLPDEEVQATGMVSVELHAYKTITTNEPIYSKPTKLSVVRLSKPPPSPPHSSSGSDYDTVNEKFLDLTVGSPICDVVHSDTLNSRK